MSIANPLWGAPRIHGELLKLGIEVGQTTVAKYMAKTRRPPSQGWKTFLVNHADGIGSMDLFVVPTLSFRLLYGVLILLHGRRELLWLGVTAHPTAEWIAQQLTEAFGWRNAPRYVVRDRDRVYSARFIQRVRAMGIRDRPIARHSPWQNGCAERLIGSIRRDCLDHVVVFGEWHLRNLLRSYQQYYNEARTHLSLCKDAPIPRAVRASGHIIVTPVLGADYTINMGGFEFSTVTGEFSRQPFEFGLDPLALLVAQKPFEQRHGAAQSAQADAHLMHAFRVEPSHYGFVGRDVAQY